MKTKIFALILLSLLLSACGDPNYKPEDEAATPPKTVVFPVMGADNGKI